MDLKALAALRTAERLLVEAIECHVYAEDDERPADCSFTAGLAEVRAAIAAEEEAQRRAFELLEDEAAVRAGQFAGLGA